jgi:hypothetical protein
MHSSCWLVAFAVASVRAQFGMDQMPKKPKPAPLKDDLKYIKCETCKRMVTEAVRQAESFTSQSAVEDMLDRLCDADADGKEGRGREGVWLAEIDISKQDRALELTHKGPGHCRRECRTVAKACDSVMEKLEPDELADLIRGSKSSAGMLAQRVCTKVAGFCKKGKVPMWPEGKVRKDEQFKAKDPKDDELEDLLASMKGMTGGGGLSMMRPGDMDLGDGKVDEIDVLRDEL